jgi:hypothetical protein
MVRVAIYAGQKVQNPFSHSVQISEDLLTGGQVYALGFGRVSGSKETIIGSRERRLSLTLLEDPERFGHTDVSEVPANRTELSVNLPTKINLVHTRTEP